MDRSGQRSILDSSKLEQPASNFPQLQARGHLGLVREQGRVWAGGGKGSHPT